MKTRILLALLAGLAVSSCGGGGGGGGSTGETGTEGPSGAYLVVAADGTTRMLSSPEALAVDQFLFVRSTATGLYIGVYPVTQQQWTAVMGTQPWSGVPDAVVEDSGAPGLPAWNLAQDEALTCAATLAIRSGLAVDLPSAAVWRAEVGDSDYPWGIATDSSTVAAYAVTDATRTIAGPSPVDGRQASAGGVHDLIGNVRQWTTDGFLVGGSWSDGIGQSGRSGRFTGVATDQRHPLSGVRLIISDPGTGNHQPAITGDVVLPAFQVGTPMVITRATLLAGATDADGDQLQVAGLGVLNASLGGHGPWTVTPGAAGAVSLSYVIVDGRGGCIARQAAGTATAVAPGSAYDRYMDYRGLLRATANSASRCATVQSANASGGGTTEFEFGFSLASFAGWVAGTPVTAVLCRSATGGSRSTIRFGTTGKIDLQDETGVIATLSDNGGPVPGEAWHCRLRFTPTTITLWRRNGDAWNQIGQVARGSFGAWMPTRLLIGGASQSCNGVIYYWMVTVDGTVVHDYRMDEMAGDGLADAVDPLASGTANTAEGVFYWIDEIPDGLVPDVDLAVSGALVHGGSLVFTSGSLPFAGGLPDIQLYDDGMSGGVARSGQVGVGVTMTDGHFVPWSRVKNASATQTYKTGGPGGRSYVVDYDGATGERVSRALDIPAGFSEVFVSRLLRIPTGRAWPGSSDNGGSWTPVTDYIPSDSTWKMDWMLTADDSGGTGSDLVLGTHSSADFWRVSGNSVSAGNPPVSIRLIPVVQFGAWFSAQAFVRHDQAAPEASRAVVSITISRVGTRISSANGYVLAAARGFEPFRLWLSGAWVDQNSLCRIERADIYAAMGGNAACRVEIGDNAVYSRCTALASSPPLAWSTSQITVRCALGIFNPATTALYAFVIGPDGLPLHTYGKRLN
jgi:hypothetical protein